MKISESVADLEIRIGLTQFDLEGARARLSNALADLASMSKKAEELDGLYEGARAREEEARAQLRLVRGQRDECNAAREAAEALVLDLRRMVDTERTEAGKKIAERHDRADVAERQLTDARGLERELRHQIVTLAQPTRVRELERVVRFLAPFRGFVLADRNRRLDQCANKSDTLLAASHALDDFAAALLEEPGLAKAYNEALR